MEVKIPLFNLKRRADKHASIITQATQRVIESGQYIGGDEVKRFRNRLAQYLNTSPEAVVTCANGSDALLITFMAADFKPGDEVIIPTHNYISAAESALRLGLRPVWADVNPPSADHYSFQINADSTYLQSLLSDRTVALVGLNMYGTPCQSVQLRTFCQENQLLYIEDNAQGLGATHESQPVGAHGDVNIMSFFPTKPLGCLGDGGALIIPNNPTLLNRAQQIAQHGQLSKYHYNAIGMNSRLDAIQATILSERLPLLDQEVELRRQIAERYDQALNIQGREFELQQQNCTSSYYLYNIIVPEEQRDSLIAGLNSEGIESKVYYPNLLHLDPFYGPLGRLNDLGCPNSEFIHRRVLSLPCDPYMTSDEVKQVIHTFNQLNQT